MCRFGLLVLFSAYLAGLSLFYHSHRVNGQFVSHSHPFKPVSGPDLPHQSHSHTPDDLTTIQNLNESLWEDIPEIQQFQPFFQPTEAKSDFTERPDFSTHLIPDFYLRAPPVS